MAGAGLRLEAETKSTQAGFHEPGSFASGGQHRQRAARKYLPFAAGMPARALRDSCLDALTRVRISRRAAAVSFVRNPAANASAGTALLAAAGHCRRRSLHPYSDVCFWRSADRWALCGGFGVSAAAGILWAGWG